MRITVTATVTYVFDIPDLSTDAIEEALPSKISLMGTGDLEDWRLDRMHISDLAWDDMPERTPEPLCDSHSYSRNAHSSVGGEGE